MKYTKTDILQQINEFTAQTNRLSALSQNPDHSWEAWQKFSKESQEDFQKLFVQLADAK